MWRVFVAWNSLLWDGKMGWFFQSKTLWWEPRLWLLGVWFLSGWQGKLKSEVLEPFFCVCAWSGGRKYIGSVQVLKMVYLWTKKQSLFWESTLTHLGGSHVEKWKKVQKIITTWLCMTRAYVFPTPPFLSNQNHVGFEEEVKACYTILAGSFFINKTSI